VEEKKNVNMERLNAIAGKKSDITPQERNLLFREAYLIGGLISEKLLPAKDLSAIKSGTVYAMRDTSNPYALHPDFKSHKKYPNFILLVWKFDGKDNAESYNNAMINTFNHPNLSKPANLWFQISDEIYYFDDFLWNRLAYIEGVRNRIIRTCFSKSAVDFWTFGLIDTLDNQRYLTVGLGRRHWMAENLNRKTGSSRCYGDADSNCVKYGRLYDWNTARKACPAGWRLPTPKEWNYAIGDAGGSKTAGKSLKAESGWDGNGNGADYFGFSALPGGIRNGDDFDSLGIGGYWWTNKEANSREACAYGIDSLDGTSEKCYDKSYGLSVRCVR
jgi:uncharacterized protein (TIGR02145 family)